MATIRKRGGKFEVQVRRRGFASVTRSFITKADAREWSRMIERQADRNELGPSARTLADITLAQLVERYRDTVVPVLMRVWLKRRDRSYVFRYINPNMATVEMTTHQAKSRVIQRVTSIVDRYLPTRRLPS